MNSLADQFAVELERMETAGWQRRSTRDLDPEVERLVALTRRLRTLAKFQVDPTFARRLEHKLHAHQSALHRTTQRTTQRSWFAPLKWRGHPLLSTAVALCFVLLLGVGMLAAAHGIENPNNPLYGIKVWEQQVQVSLASSAPNQAELYLQFARDRLDTLADLTDSEHSEAYQKALSDFDQQFTLASQQITRLPTGPERDQLTADLATLTNDAITTLHNFLPHLSLAEQFATTDELGHLGAAIPELASVEVLLPAHPNGQVTVIIHGTNLQTGAQLLVDGKPKLADGSLQGGCVCFCG